MRRILLVSKPLDPPWNDGSKNLARAIALGLRQHEPWVLATKPNDASPYRVLPVRGGSRVGFAPALTARMRIAATVATAPRVDLHHYVAQPTVAAKRVARVLSFARGVPTVQTLASLPPDGACVTPLLFGDEVVVTSRAARDRLVREGFDVARLHVVPPASVPPATPVPEETRVLRHRVASDACFLVVFAGDAGKGGGAATCLRALARLPSDTRLVLALRAKDRRHGDLEYGLKRLAVELGVGARTTWIGETPHIHAWLAAADVVAMPARTSAAKVDYPLVLLEALQLGRPTIVSTWTPARELAEGGAAIATAPDPFALADTIDSLRSDRARRDGLSARAVTFARCFHPEALGAHYDELYAALLARLRVGR